MGRWVDRRAPRTRRFHHPENSTSHAVTVTAFKASYQGTCEKDTSFLQVNILISDKPLNLNPLYMLTGYLMMVDPEGFVGSYFLGASSSIRSKLRAVGLIGNISVLFPI